jgi:hypothetical protein
MASDSIRLNYDDARAEARHGGEMTCVEGEQRRHVVDMTDRHESRVVHTFTGDAQRGHE